MGYPTFSRKRARLNPPDAYWDRTIGGMDMTRLLGATQCYMRVARNIPRAIPGALDSAWSCSTGNRRLRAEIPPLQAFASAGQHDNSAAYVLWPPSWLNDSAAERAAYFYGLQKDVELDTENRMPTGQQAATLLELMTIRAFHSKTLRRYSLGTALGFRTRQGVLTSIPAIIVFVARKVHRQWLLDVQKLPTHLEGPGGVWCDVDVVEFSYYGPPEATPKEQIYSELVEGLRGNDPFIGSGSQVASQETYGTLGAIVQSQTGSRQLGFLTNRHVAVDLDYPAQKMFHPLPPNLGPGVYLGAVERATSFIRDDLWYGIFAGMNPETFVRADGAFIPFTESFDTSRIMTTVKGVGEMGEVMWVDLQAPINSLIAKHVVKVGRSSGLTSGIIMAYAVEYNDEKGNCFFTDFLIVGENKLVFELEGDSGSLILLTGDEGAMEKPRPIGIIWGGTANRGRLKLRNGHGPENWTSGVDLGRLLKLLQLDVITTDRGLQDIYSHMLDLPEAIEVHWRHKAAGLESLTVLANKTGEFPDSNAPHEIDAYFPPVAASDLLSTSIFKNQAQASLSPRPSTVDYGASEIQVMLPEGPSLTDLKTRDHYGLTLSGPTTEIKVVFSPKRRKLVSEDLNWCQGGGDGCEAVSNDTSLDHEHPEGEVLLLDNTDLGHFNLTSCNKRQGE